MILGGFGRGGYLAHHLGGDVVGGPGPDVDDLVVFFTLGDEAVVVLVLDQLDLGLGAIENLVLFAGG